VHFADKIAEHCLGDFEIADYAVSQRSYCGNGTGCLAEHLAGNQANSFTIIQDPIGAFVNGDYGGLVEDNTFTTDTNQGGAGTEVDAHIHTKPA
jgi:hypothetical protein